MTDLDEGAFPSDAIDRPTKHVVARPFGQSEAQKLRNKQQALATYTRQECFNMGYLTVKDLDDEELRYGRCRDENGNIPERGSTRMNMIPQAKFDEMVAEHELRFKEKLRQNLDTMLGVMIKIATDDTAEPRDQFEAAKYLFERTAGKTAEVVSHTVELKPWEGMLTDITGVGAISRAEHRRMKEEGHSAGIIDVEFEDEDAVQPEGVPPTGEATAEPDVVQVHQPRPDESGGSGPGEQPSGPEGPGGILSVPTTGDVPRRERAHRSQVQHDEVSVGAGQDGPEVEDGAHSEERDQPRRPLIRREGASERPTTNFTRDPAEPTSARRPDATVPVDPDPYEQYGSRRTESKTYAQQVREAEALAARRKEAREARQAAKKSRKIARATGADAIVDDITGATVGEDGKLTFE